MSFDRRDIRPAMDVFTVEGSYLGTVLRVTPGPVRAEPAGGPATPQSSMVSGELLGPMPTRPLGNRASVLQGAGELYGTAPDGAALGQGTMLVGRWWGLLGRRTIPLSDVLTVSLERVVLKPGAAGPR